MFGGDEGGRWFDSLWESMPNEARIADEDAIPANIIAEMRRTRTYFSLSAVVAWIRQ